MVYTVTFNPSLDYIVDVEDFRLGMTNRTCSEQMMAGGKGINVSIVLQNLGIENTALGFIAGFTGEEIRRQVAEMGIRAQFISIPEGISRINLKLRSIDGTEINGMGPSIGRAQLGALYEKLDTLTDKDTLVLAGSIPASMPSSIYCDIMERLYAKGVTFVVDATKQLLLNVLRYRPFLIKPNNHELGELFGVTLSTREAVIPYARKLQEQGARNVLISMAGQGAVLVAEDGSVHLTPAPKGTLVNAVGAGDSMVAGFLAGWQERHDYGHAFRMGVAAGSASAFSRYLATREEVEMVFAQLI
ncbi:MAG: 1-phosphofructokinase [Clostridiales bacterium]|nr:1-phosphofructokinase [Clostridiales bacterium]MCI7573895.1 1-phosphofructokinase [Clostridiales bacterium]